MYQIHKLYSKSCLKLNIIPSNIKIPFTFWPSALLVAYGQAVGLAVVKGLRKASLGVLACVDKVGVVERQFNSAVVDGIDSLHAQHEGVVLVANLVAPAAEATARQNVLSLQLGEELLQDTLTLQAGSRVAVVEAAVVGGNNLVLGADHVRVDETLDAVLEESLLVNRLHARLGNLEHDGPVGTLLGLRGSSLVTVGEVEGGQLLVGLGLVVGRVVGEDGGTVEGAVILGEVQLSAH